MPQFYRIVKKKYRATAFDGSGAKGQGGRWNSPGVAMVYASSSRALACLEILVRVPRDMLMELELETHSFEIPRAMISPVPRNANSKNAPSTIGDAWIASRKSLAMLVPSIIIPQEMNILINPNHPDMARIKFAPIEPLVLDPRLI